VFADGVRVNFVPGTKTNRRNIGFACPICPIGGKIPGAGRTIDTPNVLNRALPRLHKGMRLFHKPSWEKLIQREGEAGVGRRVVVQLLDGDFLSHVISNQTPDDIERLLPGFTEGDAVVDENRKQVGDGIYRIRAGKRICDRYGGVTEHRVAEHAKTHAPVQFLNFGDERVHLINRVITQVVRGGVSGAPGGDDFQLYAALVSAVNVHLGWLADNDEIRPDARIYFHERVGRDAVAPFFHVAEVKHSIVIQEPEVPGDCQTVNHPRGAALLIAGATGIEVAVFDLADKWIPVPVADIADADCIDVRVIEQNPRTIPDAAEGVAHLIEAYFFITEFVHLGLDAFADRSNQRVCRRNGADIAQELDDIAFIFFYFGFDFLNKIHE